MINNKHYLQQITEHYNNAPKLAPSNTWYKGTANHNTYTEIHIVDTYTPTGNETETWNADVDDSGSIKCYVEGTVLTIAGNGYGRILANENSSLTFGGNSSTTRWSKVTEFTGLEYLDTRKATNMERMFDGLFLVTTLNTGHFNTSKCTNMNAMFNNCEQLVNLDVSSFRTNNVTDIYAMFADCTKLTYLDVSRWNVSNVTNFNSAFYDCYLLDNLDLSNWDARNATNMGMMFYQCHAITSINMKRTNPTKTGVVLQAIFAGCHSLTDVNLDNFDTTGISDFDYLFEHCRALEKVDLSTFNTESADTYLQMFIGCTSLVAVDLNNINTDSSISSSKMFYGCTAEGLTIYVSDEAAKTWVEDKVSSMTNVTVVIGRMP